MKIKLTFLLAAFFALVAAPMALAQTLTFSDGGTPWTIDDFNLDPATDVSTLSTTSPNYVSNLSSYVPNGASADFNASGGGWVFQNAEGTVLIADKTVSPDGAVVPTALGDPFVSYSYFFINSSGVEQNFSMTFTTSAQNFPSTTYTPSYDRATFGVTLTDGTELGTGVSATSSQSATLSNTAGGTTPLTNADLTTGELDTNSSSTGTITDRVSTPGYGNLLLGPSGTFDQLSVTVSGTYSAGADLGVSGRVDLVPEPSPAALLSIGLLAFGVAFRRRILS
jgi:hypothetical protein